MSLTSKAQAYDVLVKELFVLLDKTETTDEGFAHRPVKIYCTREQDRLQLNQILVQLKHTLEDWG
jgi:ABC-type hemin transport system ATPase subunit